MLRTRPVTVAVEETRELVYATLREWSLTHLDEVVATVAVELVANAVRHARTNLELRLDSREGIVIVEVLDYDDHLPVMIPTGPEAGYGRGLHIVQALSRRWGAVPVPGGKVVWAEIEATPPGEPPTRRVPAPRDFRTR